MKRCRSSGHLFAIGLIVLFPLFCIHLPLQPGWAQSALPRGDIVFGIDESGSMGNDIADVKANAQFIADELNETIDARFGLVGFGATSSHRADAANGHAHLHTAMTDLDGFKSAVGELVASGGLEPGLSATILGLSDGMNFRSGAAVCMVLITDEDADDSSNLEDAVAAVKNRTGTWFGVVNTGFGNTESTYGPNQGSVVTETGGSIFSIGNFRADPQPVLDAVLEDCVAAVIAKDPGQTFGPQSCAEGVPCSEDPVNLATGNYVFQAQDLAIPGRGRPFFLTRTYNSLDSAVGALGRGWTLNFAMRVTLTPGGDAVVRTEEGRRDFYTRNPDGSFTPPPGVFAELIQEPDGSFTLIRKNQTRLIFDANGLLTTIADRNGNTQTIARDGDGRITQITDTAGRVISFVHDSEGRLSEITDPIGRTIRYTYDDNGNLTTVTDPAGQTTAFAYDADNRLARIINPLGHAVVTNIYDAAGRVIGQTDARGNTTGFTYDPAINETRATDPRGNTTTYLYNDRGRLLHQEDALGEQRSFTYDAQNNRTSITDENGRTTQFTYDDRGNVTSIADPLGHVLTFTYDEQNNLTSARNANGATTTFTYDAQGNLLEIEDALGHRTSFTYDGRGQVGERLDARGNRTRYGYDGDGNLTAITDALRNMTSLGYDRIGRLVTLTDPNGHTAEAGYDRLGRLVRITDPLGHATQFGYDAVGNLVRLEDANGNITQYQFDPANNLTAVTDALGHTTTYTYDPANNRTQITDANENTTTYTFDALNRLSRLTDPLGHATQYTYDPVGNVTAITDANGTTNTFAYDALNRLVEIAYGDGSRITYAYDANGNRIRMVDEQGTTIYVYDLLDRLVEVTHPTSAVRYEYDGAGNRTALVFPDGKRIRSTYDPLNRLIQVQEWTGQTTTYTYDKAGNLVEVVYPNNTGTTYRYDQANRLLAVRNHSRRRPFAAFEYTLDPVGNRVRKVERTREGRRTIEYTYDALSQLIAVQEGFGSRPLKETRYTYDPVGNRLTKATSTTRIGITDGTSGVFQSEDLINYRYDAANRLLQAGQTMFTYDANGNRIGKQEPGKASVTYRYDAANRLVEVRSDGSTTRYAYDGDGNKVQRERTGDGGGERTGFLNDVATALPVVLRERGSTGVVRYVFGLDRISRHEAPTGETRFYHPDALASTMALTGERGFPRAQFRYDAWGNLERGADEDGERFLFTGEERDPVTNLYYLRARWYDPEVGRFLAKDPLSGITIIPKSLNTFIYALNNPLVFTDPTGLSPLTPKSRQLTLEALEAERKANEAEKAEDEIRAGISRGVAIVTVIGGVALDSLECQFIKECTPDSTAVAILQAREAFQ